MPSTYRLPIFPIPLVLLPRAVQALHMFEPRYRQLLTDCRTGAMEFGIVCRTPDVAEREIPPGTAGCVARIDSSQSLPDGRSNVLVTGAARFTLVNFVDDPAPYHVALVEPFDDEPLEPHGATGTGALSERLRELFARVGRSARALQDDAAPLPLLPDLAADLAFVIATHIDLDLADKQRLLASRSPLDRLRQLDEALAPIVESIEERASIHVRAKSNGHGTHA